MWSIKLRRTFSFSQAHDADASTLLGILHLLPCVPISCEVELLDAGQQLLVILFSYFSLCLRYFDRCESRVDTYMNLPNSQTLPPQPHTHTR